MESSASAVDTERSILAAQVGTWVFVLSDAIALCALLATAGALRTDREAFAVGDGIGPSLASGLVMTGILAAMSVLMIAAWRLPGHRPQILSGALALALGFVFLQAREFGELFAGGLSAAPPAMQAFALVAGFHGLHVAVGAVALGHGVARKGETIGPLALYWHFVDVMWLAIFALFYLGGGR